jgi:membrane-bound lytic murein transglycosylase D
MTFLRCVLLTALLVLTASLGHHSATAQQSSRKQSSQQQPPPPPKLPKIQDDFAELDDTTSSKAVFAGASDRFVNTTLENSRQQYLRALSFINKGDTVRAAKAFETSIEILNKLTDFPKIEENPDFTDLMQSIIDDYEHYIQSIDNLSENSPFFVLRDKFFQEIDKEGSPLYNELTFQKERPSRQNVIPLRLPESSSAMVNIVGMKGVPLQIPMTDNEVTQKTVEFFTNQGARKYFQKWLERAGRWFPMMRRIAREEGAPEEIIYLSMIESALIPKAVSRAQAVGLWQFIKSTGQLYGLDAGYWLDERREPEKATRAAMRHLKDLYNEFGDWHLAMAAYNCGVGGVRRAIARTGMSNPDYWDIRAKLPRETRGYVPLYIAAAKVCMNPEAYGFINIPLEEAYKYDTVAVTESVDFKVLAKCAGITTDDLEEFNPELSRSATPPGGEYWLKLPPGTKNTFLANFGKLSNDDKQTWTLHQVSSKETIQSIAKKYGISASLITEANGLTGRKKRISAGMMLKIPKEAGDADSDEAEEPMQGAAVASNSKPKSKLEEYDTRRERERERKEREKELKEQREKERTEKAAEKTDKEKTEKTEQREKDRADKSNDKAEKAPEPAPERPTKERVERSERPERPERTESVVAAIPANSKKISHSVVQGETLFSIATRYGVRLAELRNWNNIPYNSDKLSLDEPLTVYVPKNFRDESKPSTTMITHAVKQGETLAKIADDYEVSVQDIRKASGLSSKARLFIGQQLRVPAKADGRRAQQDPVPTPTVAQSQQVSSPQQPTQRPSLSGVTMHQIKKGETIRDVAERYGVSSSDLAKWNPSLKSGRIYAGAEIKIYAPGTAQGGAPSAGKSSKTYTVIEGDTAYSIAKKFGISVQQLQKLNRGLRENNLSIGQQLRVAE